MTDVAVQPPAGRDLAADLDLRLVRYFTVVAEHLNFGRAAAALSIAQPSLSRQMQRLEQQLGVRLLDRSPQGSRLTDAGEAFLVQAHTLLDAARQAATSARAAVATRALVVGYADDLVVSAAVRELRRRHPQAAITTRHLEWTDGVALTEHRVDALFARTPLPFSAEGLRVTVLYDEPRVLVLPVTHRLAGRASVHLADFSEEAFVPCAGAATAWARFWRLEPRPDGRAAPTGEIVVESYEDKLELVADGRAVAILPQGDRRISLRPDLTSVPIEGVEPCQVVLATRADEHDPLIADLHGAARAHLTGAA